MSLQQLAKSFVEAQIRHVYSPGGKSGEEVVNTRIALIQHFFPEYPNKKIVNEVPKSYLNADAEMELEEFRLP